MMSESESAINVSIGSVEDHYEALAEQNLDPVLLIDRDARIQFVNQEAASEFGFPRDTLLTMSLGDILMTTDEMSVDDIVATFAHGNSTHAELVLRNSEDQERIFAMKILPVRIDGTYQAAYVIGRDITRYRMAELTLHQLTQELSRSNRELEEFAYIASHDLQEPLRKIQAFGDRLATRWSDQLDERGVDYLTRMVLAAERMRTLIDDLLTYSRVTTRGKPASIVDLDRTVRRIIDELDMRISETGAQIELGHLPSIHADVGQVRHLMTNLITNSLKFARPDQPPIVRVFGATSDQLLDNGLPAVEIVVEDNGIGFEPRYAERIFWPFQRLHERHAYPGTGIGLAVCRKIAERHGGRIIAESQPNQGATFRVLLPAATDEATEEKDGPGGADES
jgi:PAS domain S-box-containing protein